MELNECHDVYSVLSYVLDSDPEDVDTMIGEAVNRIDEIALEFRSRNWPITKSWDGVTPYIRPEMQDLQDRLEKLLRAQQEGEDVTTIQKGAVELHGRMRRLMQDKASFSLEEKELMIDMTKALFTEVFEIETENDVEL